MILKLTSLFSNILTNNLFLAKSNKKILISQRYKTKLANLTKIYIDKGKFSSENNYFVFILTIFYDIYTRVDVPQKILFKNFPTIFSNLVLNLYYLNTSIIITTTINKIYNLI